MVSISVVGTGPVAFPSTPNPTALATSEYAAGQRLLARARSQLGARFADYLVVDGGYATAPFLHASDRAGIPIIARLKDNLPELSQSVERRFPLLLRPESIAMAKTVWRSGCGRLRPLGDLALGPRSRHPLSPTQTGSDHGPSPVVTNLPSRRVGKPLAVSTSPKAAGKSKIKDSMTPRTATAGAHLSSPSNSILIGLAACPVGPRHRTALPNPLSASRPHRVLSRTSCAAFFGSAYPPPFFRHRVDRNRNRRLGSLSVLKNP